MEFQDKLSGQIYIYFYFFVRDSSNWFSMYVRSSNFGNSPSIHVIVFTGDDSLAVTTRVLTLTRSHSLVRKTVQHIHRL